MRIVQFRRNRLFHILIGSTLMLLLLYILLNLSSDNHMNDIKEWAQGLRQKQVNSLIHSPIFNKHIVYSKQISIKKFQIFFLYFFLLYYTGTSVSRRFRKL